MRVPINWLVPFEWLWFSGALLATWTAVFAKRRLPIVCELGILLAILGSALTVIVCFGEPTRVDRIGMGNGVACENLVVRGPRVAFYVVRGAAWWPVNRVVLQREFPYRQEAEQFGSCRIDPQNPDKLLAEIPGETISVPIR